MLTGNLVHSSEWEGRNVAGQLVGNFITISVDVIMKKTFALCTGSWMLRLPVFQTIYRWNHKKVFLSLNDEIQNVRDVAMMLAF